MTGSEALRLARLVLLLMQAEHRRDKARSALNIAPATARTLLKRETNGATISARRYRESLTATAAAILSRGVDLPALSPLRTCSHLIDETEIVY